MTQLFCAATSTELSQVLPHQPVLSEAITDQATVVWTRNGHGMVGFGVSARFEATGPDRFAHIRSWWDQVLAESVDPLDETGHHNLRAFSAMSFDDRSQVSSVVVVPEILLIHDDDATRVLWQMNAADPTVAGRRIGGWEPTGEEVLARLAEFLPQNAEPAVDADEATHQTAIEAYQPIPKVPAEIHPDRAFMSPSAYVEMVEIALDRIESGELQKMVAARDEVLASEHGIDVAATLKELTAAYRHSWTYRVENLIGSTPELLMAKQQGTAHARVLAGTIDREALPEDTSEEDYLGAELVENSKQRFEHQASVDSLVQRIEPLTENIDADDEPFVLQLPNVWHLATDVSATVNPNISLLDLVAAVNPTAAVGGAPRQEALNAIFELEVEQHGMDRGHYAGPVGWFDGNLDGEFGIALRGGVLEDANTIRLFAGCGIVEGSVADDELAETHAKMRPMLNALRINLPTELPDED